MTRRPYQHRALKLFRQYRTLILFFLRQGGKTTTEAEAALMEMMRVPGRLVTYATATLLLGREMIMREAQVLQSAVSRLAEAARAENLKLELRDHNRPGLNLGTDLGVDDFADLFESKRLEFWLRHSRTVASRTQVIAPSVGTARGWTGTVILDEIGHIPDFRDLWTAMEPIISSQPDFHMLMAGTPPEDDTHFSFEMFAEPPGTVFTPSAEGNLFENEFRIPVFRVDVDDARLAGKKSYDLVTGAEISTEEHRKQAPDRDGWDRNYKLKLKHGGTGAVSMMALKEAQDLGQGHCLFLQIDEESDLDTGIDWLREHMGGGAIGLGWDLATTEEERSNPSALNVTERIGNQFWSWLVLAWKTADEQLAERIVEVVLEEIAARPEGGRAKRMCIDATNERYFAQTMRRRFARLVPVELVIGSETIEVPGEKEPMTMKAFLGNLYANAIEDRLAALPPERYLKEDYRLVRKLKGSFECEVGADGRHGDTFDAGKLALRALKSSAGAILSTEGMHVGGNPTRSGLFRPRRLLRTPELTYRRSEMVGDGFGNGSEERFASRSLQRAAFDFGRKS